MNKVMMYAPPQDMWMLIDPEHRFLHLFPAYNDNKESLCGLSYARGTYVRLDRKPTKHCPECERKYQEME